jgi:hypothetical protein
MVKLGEGQNLGPLAKSAKVAVQMFRARGIDPNGLKKAIAEKKTLIEEGHSGLLFRD